MGSRTCWVRVEKIRPSGNERGGGYRKGDTKARKAPPITRRPPGGVKDWGKGAQEVYGMIIVRLQVYLLREGGVERLHVDSSRSHLNVIVIGDKEMDLSREVFTLVNQTEGTIKIRDDAVRLDHVMASVSEEVLYPNGREAGIDYAMLGAVVDAFKAFCVDLAGGRRDLVLLVVLHRDEHMEHLHATIVPIDDRNRLDHNGLFHGKEDGRRIQDLWAEAVRHLGIERGQARASIDHQDARAFARTFHDGQRAANDIIRDIMQESRAMPQGTDMALYLSQEKHRIREELSDAFGPHMAHDIAVTNQLKHMQKLEQKERLRQQNGTEKAHDDDLGMAMGMGG